MRFTSLDGHQNKYEVQWLCWTVGTKSVGSFIYWSHVTFLTSKANAQSTKILCIQITRGKVGLNRDSTEKIFVVGLPYSLYSLSTLLVYNIRSERQSKFSQASIDAVFIFVLDASESKFNREISWNGAKKLNFHQIKKAVWLIRLLVWVRPVEKPERNLKTCWRQKKSKWVLII